MKLHLRSIVPTRHELLLASLLALFLTIVSNSLHIFNQYISNWLGTASNTDARAVAYAITTHIDAYKPSRTIITFLLWSLLGLFLYALGIGLQHTWQRVAYLQRMNFRRRTARGLWRRHPWTKAAFWKQWCLTSLGSFVALGTAGFIMGLFIICILPISLIYTRVFIGTPNIFNTFFGLMGVSMLVIGLILVFVAIRLVCNRRRLLRLR